MNEKINQWLFFMDDYDKEMIKLAEEKNPTLKKARIEMEYLTGDEEVKRLQFLREKWEMDRVSDMNYAEEKGIEKGIMKEKKETVKAMLKEGISIEMIERITKITKKEIEKIKNETKEKER